jgi:hypothetical protein
VICLYWNSRDWDHLVCPTADIDNGGARCRIVAEHDGDKFDPTYLGIDRTDDLARDTRSTTSATLLTRVKSTSVSSVTSTPITSHTFINNSIKLSDVNPSSSRKSEAASIAGTPPRRERIDEISLITAFSADNMASSYSIADLTANPGHQPITRLAPLHSFPADVH